MGINKSNLYGVARGAIWGRFSNIAAVAVWWNTSPSVASIITRLSRRECPSGRQQKNSSNSRAVGNTECAGINRHVVGDERALQERKQRIHPGLESCRRYREVALEA